MFYIHPNDLSAPNNKESYQTVSLDEFILQINLILKFTNEIIEMEFTDILQDDKNDDKLHLELFDKFIFLSENISKFINFIDTRLNDFPLLDTKEIDLLKDIHLKKEELFKIYQQEI